MTLSAVSRVPNVRAYVCGKVRRVLDSYQQGELTVESNHEILEHLEGCAGCQAESGARERLRAAIRRVAGVAVEPRAGLETETRALIGRTPAPSRRFLPAVLS